MGSTGSDDEDDLLLKKHRKEQEGSDPELEPALPEVDSDQDVCTCVV